MKSPEVPHSFIDIIRKNALNRPKDVGSLLLARITNSILKKNARLNSGQEMQVMIPEWTSSLIWFAGDCEPAVTIALHKLLKQDMKFWNIGAHIGLRVVQADQLVGANGVIHAFEPTPRTTVVLNENVKGRKSRISTHPIAVGDASKTAVLQDFGWRFSGCNTVATTARIQLGRFTKNAPISKKVSVPLETVDVLISNHGLSIPDVIAIDAEGYELEILQGARSTLHEHRPSIIFETGDLGESKTVRCIQTLQTHGYSIFEVLDDTLQPHDSKDSYPNPGNLIAIHPEATRLASI